MEKKDLIGVALHLEGSAYQSAVLRWEIDLPASYKCELKDLESFRYVGLIVNGEFKSLAKVDSWCFDFETPGTRRAIFSTRSDDAKELTDDLRHCISDIKWLTNDQESIVQKVMIQDRIKVKPLDKVPSLDLTEASLAVSRYFSIDSKQVEITIRSRPAYNG